MPDDSCEQSVRTQLRIDFLRAINNLRGQKCDITLLNGVKSEGSVFKGADRDGLHFGVQNLHTPTGETLEHALIRATDVKTISFDAKEFVKQ